MKHKTLKFLLSFLLIALAIPIANADEVTICSGTTTNENVPFNGYYLDTSYGYLYGQMIYPESELGLSAGDQITAITFYANGTYTPTCNFQVAFGTTTATTISSPIDRSTLTKCFDGNLPTGSSEITIQLTTPYTYNGDNLIIDVYRPTKINSCCSYGFAFYGMTADAGSSYYYRGNNNGQQSFLPKIKIEFETASLADYAASVSPKAEDGLDFGAIAVGASKTIDVTLRNKGTNTFTPTVNVSGTGFSTTYTSAEIPSKGSAAIPVVFSPTSAGNYTGTLSINCGQAGSFIFDLTGSAANEITICDENTTTEGYLPVYGAWHDANQHNQIIYPAEMLTSLVGKNINGLTFYPQSGLSFYGGSVSIRLSTVEQSTFSSAELITTGIPTEAMGTVVPVQNAETLKIDFEAGKEFNYTGGNLLVDIQTVSGTYGSTSFVGVSQDYGNYISIYTYNNTKERKYLLPKVKFTFEDSSAPTTPTITVNPATLDAFSTEVGTAVTQTMTVTGANLTSDITVAASGEGFSVSPTTIAAADAANGVTVTVTYDPAAAGNHTGTLTLSSNGATSKTVNLSGSATLPTVPTITTNVDVVTINTDPYTAGSATFTVTGTNLTNDINLSVQGSGFAVIPNTIAAANAANGVTVTVTYSAQEAGTFNGTITLTSDGAEAKAVTVTANVIQPVISGTVTPATLNFSCQEGQTNTATITVENTGNKAFTPAFSIAAPFSIEAATEIAAGESKQYTVTYAPTAAGTHTGTLTVTINGTDTQVALNGTASEAPEGGELIVAESTNTSDANLSSIAPIYGGKYNTTGKVQMLYPASLLTDMVGKQITKVVFRHKGAPVFSGGVVQVSIGETENNTLSGLVAENELTAVATVNSIGSAFDSDYYLTFEFSKPYLYNGGNLVIETNVTTKGSESRSRFYGKTTSQLSLGNITTLATSYSAQSGNGYSTSFLPQATFTYQKATGVELVSPEDGVLNFGEVSVKGHKTMTITVKNNNSAAVTPSYTQLAYPYSVVDAPESIAAGETATISVDMKPNTDTEDITYNGVTLTLTFGAQTMNITINGKSHVNEPTMTTEDFAEITYTWKDDNDETHTSNLAEVATEPAQMIALMREVYVNRNVPGNWYRGYTKAGEPSYEVAYPAIGKIVYDGDALDYTYSDSYGWNIGFGENVTDHILDNTTYNYKYFNPDEYKPIKNGVTLLLVEMNDNIVSEDGESYTEIVNGISSIPTGYASLKNMVGTAFKSVRVVTQSRNMGAGEEAGTLFKLDCDKLNRFFLLAKGRLRMFSIDVDRQHGSYINASSTGNSYREAEEMGPFYQMFEQLSPVDLANVSDVTDVYQKLVNMESYGIEHDCQSIPFISYDGVTGHEFNMYGKASISDDCQDVRDLMITIPARRMQWWYEGAGNNSRDGYSTEQDGNDMFVNYNKQRTPKMGLFVIKQFPIDGEKQENANVYDLNLSWTSNLLEFLPTGYGVYNLYRVVTNADGTKTYTKVVDNLDPNTFSYVDHIEMQQTGQVVTYVVQGQDQEQFLSLQLSNEESFIIPGLDRREQIIIALNNDYYYSRYDAANQKNNYSNSLIANNTVGTNVKPEYLTVWQEGSDKGMFKFWRATFNTVEGEQVVDTENAVNFANCKVTALSETSGTLTYEAGDDQATFTIGYHQNPTTSTISIVNGEVKFDGLKLYDNFSVSVAENTHPAQYVYYVTLKTAVPFNLNDEGTETSDEARSNTVSVPVYKTGMAMNPLSKNDVDNDDKHLVPAATKFDVNARYSSKSEILGYYIYRWADKEVAADERSIYEDNGDDASPQGQAGNQGTYYTVAMNTDFTGQTENFAMDANGNHPDVTASFEDNFMVNQAQNADTYTYAPVVELFAPQQAYEIVNGNNVDREDYNTYGGPQQMTAGGKVVLSLAEVGQSTNPWQLAGSTDNYAFYNVFIKVDVVSIPDGYELYKVRAWRKAKTDDLGESTAVGGNPDRLGYEAEGGYSEYCYDEIDNCSVSSIKDYQLGSEVVSTNPHHIWNATFGARNVGTKAGDVTELPLTFTVRAYFTKASKDGETDYYIAESTYDCTIDGETVITGITDVNCGKQVVDVTYYNMTGAASKVAFDGVNVVVTRYTDGTTSTRKVIK